MKKRKPAPSNPDAKANSAELLGMAIPICAYLIWENEGRPSGRDRIHWLEAEMQLARA